MASILGVATLRLDYSFYTTRHGLDQPIEQALGGAATHLIDVLHQLSSRLCLWPFSQTNFDVMPQIFQQIQVGGTGWAIPSP